MMAAILDSAILVFPLKLTNTCQDWFPPFKQKKTPLTLPSPPFAQKTSLIHSDSTWWWQPSGILPLGFHHFQQKNLTHSFRLNLMMAAILNSTILDSANLHKKTSLIHSDSNWWWQPSWILPCWIQPQPSWNQTPCYLLSDSLKNTLTLLWLWLKLIQSS